jgi:hypothetical protein
MKKLACSAAIAMVLGSSTAQALSIDITAMHFYDAFGSLGSPPNQPTTTVLFNSALGGIAHDNTWYNTWQSYQAMWDDTITGSSANWSGTSASGYYSYDYTLDAGEVAVGIMFNMGAAVDIAILQIFDCSDTVNCIGVNNDLTHPDVPGSEMVNGPFIGQHLTFSGSAVAPVPIPAAVWLFGSGLIGLIGMARRKKV